MRPSQACVDLVKSFEGYAKRLPDGRCQAYPDPGSGGDPWTVGYGSTGPDIKPGVIWTRAQAEARLAADLAHFSARVGAGLSGAPTTQAQFDACVAFAYNVGINAFLNSTLLRKHIGHDYEGAAQQFARWNKANGKVMAGLTRRRAAEAQLYRERSA